MDNCIFVTTRNKGTVAVPPHVVQWLRQVFKLIRCGHVTPDTFFHAWFTDGHAMEELNEGVVANFLLSSGMIDRATWSEHRRVCVVKMFFGSDPRYARNVGACAKACQVELGFAQEAVRHEP